MRAPLLPRRGAKSAQPPHACSPRFSPSGLPRSAYKPLPPTKRKEGKKAGAARPRYASLLPSPPQRVPGLHAATGGSHSPPARARRTPTSAASPPHSPTLDRPFLSPGGDTAGWERGPHPYTGAPLCGEAGPGAEPLRARRRKPLL